MEKLAISTQRIAAAGTGVADVGHALTRELAAMEGLLADISAGWQSDTAAPRFAALMHGYLIEATSLKDALLRSSAALLTTGSRFAEAETSLTDGMRIPR